MRFRVDIDGDLNKAMAAETRTAERAVTRAVRQATRGLERDLRGATTRAGLGRRLTDSWRSRSFPPIGASLGAVGFVWTRAPRIIAGQAARRRLDIARVFRRAHARLPGLIESALRAGQRR